MDGCSDANIIQTSLNVVKACHSYSESLKAWIMSPSAGMIGMRWNMATSWRLLLSQWPDIHKRNQPRHVIRLKSTLLANKQLQHQKQHDIIEAFVPDKWPLFKWPSVKDSLCLEIVICVMVKTWDECGMVIHLMGTLLIGGLRTMPEDMYVIQVLTVAHMDTVHMDHGWPSWFPI